MSIVTMKIGYVPTEDRSEWKTLEDVMERFSEAEIVEMVQRYQDTQRHALAYRERAKIKTQLMKARLAELEAQVKASEK